MRVNGEERERKVRRESMARSRVWRSEAGRVSWGWGEREVGKTVVPLCTSCLIKGLLGAAAVCAMVGGFGRARFVVVRRRRIVLFVESEVLSPVLREQTEALVVWLDAEVLVWVVSRKNRNGMLKKTSWRAWRAEKKSLFFARAALFRDHEHTETSSYYCEFCSDFLACLLQPCRGSIVYCNLEFQKLLL